MEDRGLVQGERSGGRGEWGVSSKYPGNVRNVMTQNLAGIAIGFYFPLPCSCFFLCSIKYSIKDER